MWSAFSLDVITGLPIVIVIAEQNRYIGKRRNCFEIGVIFKFHINQKDLTPRLSDLCCEYQTTGLSDFIIQRSVVPMYIFPWHKFLFAFGYVN